MEKRDTSRRDFLITGLLASVAVGCSDKNPFVTDDQQVTLSGEKVKLLSADGEIIEIDKALLKPVPDLPQVSNSEARKGIAGKKFVMVIDLSRCKNLKKMSTSLQSCSLCGGCTKLDKSTSNAGC